MATDQAARSFSENATSLGDKIANLTLKEAKELSDYLESKYGIKPAAGGAVVMAPAGDAAAPAAKVEPTEFNVVLEGFDAAKKLNVIKVVRSATGLGLKEAKDLVEGAPKTVKEALSKDDAAKLKDDLEKEGAKIAIKPVG